MKPYPIPQYPTQHENVRQNQMQVLSLAYDNTVSTNLIVLGMLVNAIFMIVILLLSRTR
jgi:hypothetical protein